MLYFYCCEVKIREEATVNLDGCQWITKRIETPEEYFKAVKILKKDVFQAISSQMPGFKLEDMNMHLTAFNPL